LPADIALDADYMAELRRRQSLMGFWGGESSKSPKDFNEGIVRDAQNPILEGAPPPPDTRALEQKLPRRQEARESAIARFLVSEKYLKERPDESVSNHWFDRLFVDRSFA
jgi:hypothetical protein